MYTEEGLNMMVASMYKHPAESQATMPQKGVMATTGQFATSRIMQYSKSPAGRMDAKGNGGV